MREALIALAIPPLLHFADVAVFGWAEWLAELLGRI